MLEGRRLNSILITRLRYLGDVVMATPLLEVLRRGDPEVRLGFLAEKSHGLVLQGHPNLDELHLLDTRRRGSDAQSRATASISHNSLSLSSLEMLSCLRESQYDLAVDLFFNPRSAWLLRLAGIPRRIAGTSGSRRFLFSHNVIPSHRPARFRGLFKSAKGGIGEHLARLEPLVHGESGLGFLEWFQREYENVNLGPFLPRDFWSLLFPEKLADLGLFISQAPVILAPGATWPVKQWPLQHWKELIRGLLKQTKNPLFIIQPPGDGSPWAELGVDIPSPRGGVLPVMDLTPVLGILSRAALLVSVDGGIMHAGVGLQVPTVGLFGPTDPKLWFPYTNAGPFRVLSTETACAPCDLHHCDQFICLPDLKPDHVLDQCLDLILER